MNWVDFVIIGIIAISAIVSFFRGFLREALSLLIWVIAIWMAVMFYPAVEPMIPQDWGLPATVRMALAGAGILLGVLILGGFVTWALGSFLDKTGMSGTSLSLSHPSSLYFSLTPTRTSDPLPPCPAILTLLLFFSAHL